MLRDGFLRFCNDPEIACCKAERELEQLRTENASLREQLAEAQRRERAAVEQIEQQMIFDAQKGCEPCEICSNADKTPCEECNPKWRGLQAGKEMQ